jgi:hypothetical protein
VVVFQPAVLRFEAKDTSKMHDSEEHNHQFMGIGEGMTRPSGCHFFLLKAIKERVNESNIVGKARFQHCVTSSKGKIGLSSEGYAFFRLSQGFRCNCAHPSVNLLKFINRQLSPPTA